MRMITALDLNAFKSNVVKTLGSDKELVSLVLDKPDIEIGTTEADSIYDDKLLDYGYSTDTQYSATAMILVDAALIRRSTMSISDFSIIVQVICHKDYMKIDTKKFHKRGNRRDLISNRIYELLDGMMGVGIGALLCTGVEPSTQVPPNYTSVVLTYESSAHA